MAACDNIYGGKKEWKELYDFLKRKKPEYLIFMKEKPKRKGKYRICYIADIQGYLFKRCHLKWVNKKLIENFNIQTLICGKPHHYEY